MQITCNYLIEKNTYEIEVEFAPFLPEPNLLPEGYSFDPSQEIK